MKKIFAMLSIFCCLPPVYSQVPQLINFQGRLLNGTNLVNGNVGLSLRLFNVPSGGATIAEDSNSVTVVDGLYSTFIGDNMTVGTLAGMLTNAAVYVEVTVNGTTLTPRERIASVSYALNVNAEGIAGQIADSKLSTNVARLSVPNTAEQATGYPTTFNGFVVGATVTSGGSGYLTPPAVTVNDSNGVGAIILASISGGAVTGLAVQVGGNGNGYSTNATLTIDPPPSNAYQTFSGVNNFTGVNTMSNVSNSFSGSFSGNFSGSFIGSGILPWQTVSATNVQAESNNGYLLVNDALVTVTLPSAPNIGDIVRVSGSGVDGWKIAQNAGQSVLNVPGNIGILWTPREFNRQWASVSSSENGNKLIATEQGGNGRIYISTNSGVSWVQRASNMNWVPTASSSDGTILVAGVYGSNIYTSTDSGENWTPRDSSRSWNAIASSADGTKLVAGVLLSNLYTSVNSGTNWTQRDSVRGWYGLASSADGSKLVATEYGGLLYTSINSGTSWVPRASIKNWISVASSADGNNLVAAAFGSNIFTSVDAGVTWTPRDSSRDWNDVASSADGRNLVAVVQFGRIYSSTDYGVSWTARENSRYWRSVASSSDGSKLVATVVNGQIYTSSPDSTIGTTGYLLGDQHSAIELQYIGNGQFIPLSHEGNFQTF